MKNNFDYDKAEADLFDAGCPDPEEIYSYREDKYRDSFLREFRLRPDDYVSDTPEEKQGFDFFSFFFNKNSRESSEAHSTPDDDWEEKYEDDYIFNDYPNPDFYATEENYLEAREEHEQEIAWREEYRFEHKYGDAPDPDEYDSEDEYLEAVEEMREDEWRDQYRSDYQYGDAPDPDDYDTENEYFDALEEERYAWREKYRYDYETGYAPDPDEHNSEKEYLDALNNFIPPKEKWKYDIKDAAKYKINLNHMQCLEHYESRRIEYWLKETKCPFANHLYLSLIPYYKYYHHPFTDEANDWRNRTVRILEGNDPLDFDPFDYMDRTQYENDLKDLIFNYLLRKRGEKLYMFCLLENLDTHKPHLGLTRNSKLYRKDTVYLEPYGKTTKFLIRGLYIGSETNMGIKASEVPFLLCKAED